MSSKVLLIPYPGWRETLGSSSPPDYHLAQCFCHPLHPLSDRSWIIGLSNQLFPHLFCEHTMWNVQQRSLQYVQEGVSRLFRMDALNTFPRLNWPNLLKVLFCVDTNFVEPVFGLRSDLDEIRDSCKFGRSHGPSF